MGIIGSTGWAALSPPCELRALLLPKKEQNMRKDNPVVLFMLHVQIKGTVQDLFTNTSCFSFFYMGTYFQRQKGDLLKTEGEGEKRIS